MRIRFGKRRTTTAARISSGDWAFLRRGLLAPASAALAATALASGLWLARGHAGNKAAEAASSLAVLEQERNELAGRLEARQRYTSRYQEVAATGIAAPEERLAWVQAARSTADALGLPYLRYSAAPQRPFTADYLLPGVAAPVLASRIELQAGLVHELDLLKLLAGLERAPGLYSVRGCVLERVGKDTAPEPGRSNLTASCQLDWLSIPPDGALLTAVEGEVP